MLSLIYASSATHLFSHDELLALLEVSRANNARLDVTGMLLYKDGNFMQVLEGPEDAVRPLYNKINQDPRHAGVLVLLEETIAHRQFPDWSMGFRNLEDANTLAEVPGYNAFLNEPLNSPAFQANPSRAQKLLLTFRRIM